MTSFNKSLTLHQSTKSSEMLSTHSYEKKPYLDRVIELKAKYEKAMEIYNATEKEGQEWTFVQAKSEIVHKIF
ncbi:hypothetical protein P8452_37644 [Trifolium repens]|nr:hypothetical protein P8452_37644 [Trifolium repens]